MPLAKNGDIVWINGGKPTGESRLKTIKIKLYSYAVSDGELTLADDTYKDKDYFLIFKISPKVGRECSIDSIPKIWLILFCLRTSLE